MRNGRGRSSASNASLRCGNDAKRNLNSFISAQSLRSAMAIVACVNFLTILAFWQLKRRIDVLQAR